MNVILSETFKLLGKDCRRLLHGGYKNIIQHLDRHRLASTATLKDKVIDARRVLLARTAQLNASVEGETVGEGTFEPAEEGMADMETPKQALVKEIALMQADILRLEGGDEEIIMAEPALSAALINWELAATMLVPLLESDEIVSPEWAAATVQPWVDHTLGTYGETKSFYFHFLADHLADHLRRLQSDFPGLRFASFSAQISEHCNKLVKSRVVNLYPFLNQKINSLDMVIQDFALRILCFHKTIPHTRTRQCGACKERGHIRTSTSCKARPQPPPSADSAFS